jgi:hypothetical protein
MTECESYILVTVLWFSLRFGTYCTYHVLMSCCSHIIALIDARCGYVDENGDAIEQNCLAT